MIESMLSTVAPAALITPAISVPLTAPAVPTAIDSDNVIALVRNIKSMGELGCEPFLGEQDAEIAGRWMRKVENNMTKMRVPEDCWMNYASQLLTDRA